MNIPNPSPKIHYPSCGCVSGLEQLKEEDTTMYVCELCGSKDNVSRFQECACDENSPYMFLCQKCKETIQKHEASHPLESRSSPGISFRGYLAHIYNIEKSNRESKQMSAHDILLSLEGKDIKVWKVPSGDVAVEYQNCDIKDGMFLRSEFGVGQTFYQACEDYLNKIHGKTLVFNAYSKNREEIRVL